MKFIFERGSLYLLPEKVKAYSEKVKSNSYFGVFTDIYIDFY
jgi:hypothetical protein